MNIRWLKDFIAVAELGSFSRAADARAITQPAMSRHIKGLEDQIGFKLIDRSSFPARLTPAGQKFVGLARNLLDDLEAGIRQIRQQEKLDAASIRFAMQHVLAAEFFASWWQSLKLNHSGVQVKVEAANFHDCLEKLDNGHCDLAACFHLPGLEFAPETSKYAGKRIAEDVMLPVSVTDSKGNAKFSLPSGKDIVPIASSGAEDFMGKVVKRVIERNGATGAFDTVYEDSFSEGVRSQAMIGTGLAWLPGLLIEDDLANGRLVVVGGEEWQQKLDIYLYADTDRLSGMATEIWQGIQ